MTSDVIHFAEFAIVLAICWIAYTYVGYAGILWAVGKLRKPIEERSESDELPSIEIIVPAHNEEQIIGDKIRNCLEFNYPARLRRIQIVADGCTDRTAQTAKSYEQEQVVVRVVKQQSGKNHAVNHAVRHASGDILVITDANALVSRDALERLAKHFWDVRVGVVSGNLVLSNPNQLDVGVAEMKYWSYEQTLRCLESRFHSIVGANGSFFAIRRELYYEVANDVMDDLIILGCYQKTGPLIMKVS